MKNALKKNLGIKDIVPEERPRERLMRLGAGRLSNAELLSIIISSGNNEESAIDLAAKLLSLVGNMVYFSSSKPEEYQRVKGIGTATACKIAAAVEFGMRVSSSSLERVKLDQPEKLAEYCADLRHLQKEVFRIVMINAKLEAFGIHDVSMGGIANASADAREVFSEAIRRGAYAIMLVHNHPSGNPEPSSEDIAVSEKLSECGRLLGINVVDHVIIGDGSYYSFKEHGLIFG